MDLSGFCVNDGGMHSGCHIHWVSGKGGVGKSTFSYLLAQEFADKGERSLVVEIGDRSFFSYALGQDFQYQEKKVEENVFLAHWHWQECLLEYILHFVKLPSLANLFFSNSIMKNITAVAPGIAEISILGKLTSGIRNVGPEFQWDHIILDAHSTGHSKSYLLAPAALHDSIGIGPLGQHAKGIDEVLRKQDRISYYLVTLPEDLPTIESLEFQSDMRDLMGIDFQIILNQYFHTSYFENVESLAPDFASYVKAKQEKQEKALVALANTGMQRKLAFLGRKGDYSEWIRRLREKSSDLVG